MNNFRKIAALLLSLSLMLSMFALTALAQEEQEAGDDAADVILSSAAAGGLASLPEEDVQYSQDYRFIHALSILELLPDGYWQTEQVTRADFATITAKTLKANTSGYPSYNVSPYSDIDASNPAYPSVCYLTDTGILSGDGNSAFRPDDAVTVSEAIKMLLCALGYQEACEESGGYPMGYVTFANRQSLFSGVALNLGDTMTALQMSRLVRNALEANIMEAAYYTQNGKEYRESDKTLLSDTYQIEKADGIITGTYFSYYGNGEVNKEDEIMIGNTAFQYDTAAMDAEQYLGYQMRFYYMDDVAGYRRSYVVFMEPRNGKNTLTEVKGQDVKKLNSQEITYYDPKTSREKTLPLTADTEVSYNGKPIDLDEKDLLVKEGSVKIISHNSTASADVILIQEYYDGIFERLNNKDQQVVFKNNSGVKLPEMIVEEDGVYRTRLTLNGKEIKVTDLKKNDVITYTASKDGYYLRGYISRDEIDGTVTESRTEQTSAGDVQVVVLDGATYYVSLYTRTTIKAGMTNTFMLTFDGRILDVSTSSNSGGNYAYMIGFSAAQNALSADIAVKLLDRSGSVHVLDCASKVKSNVGGTLKTYTTEQLAKFANEFEDRTVVLYDTNSNDEIKTLYLPMDYKQITDPPDELGFGIYYSDSSTRLQNNLVASCAINDDTLVFRVPFVDRDRVSDYSVVPRSEVENGSYSVDIYDVENGIANVLVIKDKEPAKLSDSADVLVVDEMVTTYDEEKQEAVKMITGFVNGEEVSYKIDDDASQPSEDNVGTGKDIRTVSRGDVVQFSLGSNDEIYIYRVLFDMAATGNTENYFEYNEKKIGSYQISNNELYVLFGKVLSVYDYYFVETTKPDDKKYFRAYPTTDVNLYELDQEKDELTLGDQYNIEAGDKVFIRTKYIDQSVDILIIHPKD